jgi:hypothetical protein
VGIVVLVVLVAAVVLGDVVVLVEGALLVDMAAAVAVQGGKQGRRLGSLAVFWSVAQ